MLSGCDNQLHHMPDNKYEQLVQLDHIQPVGPKI